jgi:hypothetical protein
MTIENVDRKLGYITITLDAVETVDLTNLLHHARKAKKDGDKSLSTSELELNADIIMAHSILKNGFIPDFELELINSLRKEA